MDDFQKFLLEVSGQEFKFTKPLAGEKNIFFITFRLVLTVIFSAVLVVAGVALNGELDMAEPLPLVLGIPLAFKEGIKRSGQHSAVR